MVLFLAFQLQERDTTHYADPWQNLILKPSDEKTTIIRWSPCDTWQVTCREEQKRWQETSLYYNEPII